MIERNRHPSGRLGNMTFGLCHLVDGLVRLLSLGFLHTNLPITWARNDARRRIERIKRSL